MLKIWKYAVDEDGLASIPGTARLVHAGPDPDGRSCVWALVDPTDTEPTTHHRFKLAMTGLDDLPDDVIHHGTYVVGPIVFHIVELPSG